MPAESVVFILGSPFSGTSQLANYFISLGMQPPLGAHPDLDGHRAGESFWVCGLTMFIERRLHLKFKDKFLDPNYSVTTIEAESIKEVFDFNSNIQIIKCPAMSKSYYAWSRFVKTPLPIVIFRNPRERAIFKSKEPFIGHRALETWMNANLIFLKLGAPVIELGAIDYEQQFINALAFYDLPFKKEIFNKTYIPDRIHDRPWPTNLELLPIEVREIYEQLVKRSKRYDL